MLSWLLAIVLIAGQWLVSAHASTHWQPEQAKAHLCAMCVHHAGEQALTGSAPALSPLVAGYAHLRSADVIPTARRAAHHYQARGPPEVLA